MNLPVRLSPNQNRHSNHYPRELSVDGERHTGGIPWLHGQTATALPETRHLLLRIYNRAGIPIIEGRATVAAGQRHITFSDMRALGIEAYAHARESEREQVARRIWKRHSYGTLTELATP